VREGAGGAVTVRVDDGRALTVPGDRIARRADLPPRPGVLTLLARSSLAGLAAFVALYGIPMALCACRWWRLVIDQGVALSYLGALRLNLIGTFFNNFLLGATGGDVVKAALAGAEEGKTARLLSTVLIDRIVGLGVVVLIGAVGLMGYRFFAPPIEQARLAAPGVGVSVVLAALLVLYLSYYNRFLRESAPVRWIAARLPLRKAVREMDDVFVVFRAKPRLISLTMGISVVSQLALIASLYVAGRALGIREASFLHYVVMVPLIEVAIAAPISFAGWGVGEYAYQILFGLVGVEPEKAVALSILSKLAVVVYGLPGAVLFALGKRTRRQAMPTGQ